MTANTIPPRWYALTADGRATLCVDEADAIETARQGDIAYPDLGPHVAVQLSPVTLSISTELEQPAMPAGAARDVLAERRRQIKAEGWTLKHDDMNLPGDMAKAAACYALSAADFPDGDGTQIDLVWPFANCWWKPASQRRNLVKAGALVLAEIERIDRAEAHDKGES